MPGRILFKIVNYLGLKPGAKHIQLLGSFLGKLKIYIIAI